MRKEGKGGKEDSRKSLTITVGKRAKSIERKREENMEEAGKTGPM